MKAPAVPGHGRNRSSTPTGPSAVPAAPGLEKSPLARPPRLVPRWETARRDFSACGAASRRRGALRARWRPEHLLAIDGARVVCQAEAPLRQFEAVEFVCDPPPRVAPARYLVTGLAGTPTTIAQPTAGPNAMRIPPRSPPPSDPERLARRPPVAISASPSVRHAPSVSAHPRQRKRDCSWRAALPRGLVRCERRAHGRAQARPSSEGLPPSRDRQLVAPYAPNPPTYGRRAAVALICGVASSRTRVASHVPARNWLRTPSASSTVMVSGP